MNFGSNNLIKISTEKDAFERLFFMPPDCCKSDEKGQMAVIRALGYKQVGGYTDEAADAASSPARYARGRRSQAHARNETTRANGNQSGGERAASPLNRLAMAARIFRRAIL